MTRLSLDPNALRARSAGGCRPRLLAAVAEAARVGGIHRRIAFKIRAGQIVEQHLELRVEEVAPARGEMSKERRLVRHELVMAFVKAMDFRERKVPTEQVRDGRVLKPMPVQPPLAPRIDEPVEHEGLQDLIPARALAAGRKFITPELAEAKLLPQLAAQPACAPLARTAQGHLRQPHAHDRKLLDAHGGRGVLLGKERDLLRRVVVLAEELDGLAPGRFLHAIEFTQVKNVPLDDALVGQPPVFDDTPIEMLFAILATF